LLEAGKHTHLVDLGLGPQQDPEWEPFLNLAKAASQTDPKSRTEIRYPVEKAPARTGAM
jgi:hypothetical protein